MLLNELGDVLLTENGSGLRSESETTDVAASLGGVAVIGVFARATLSAATSVRRIGGTASIGLSASGVVNKRKRLQATAGLVLGAVATLSATAHFIPLSANATLNIGLQAVLRGAVAARSVPLSVQAQLSLTLRNGNAQAPRLRGQRINGKLTASVYAHKQYLRLSWAMDDAAQQDVVIQLLSLDGDQPLICDLAGFVEPNDGVLHRCIIQAWSSADGRQSPRASVVVDIPSNTAYQLSPPKRAVATQVRDWTAEYRDMTRIAWDWGDDDAGLVAINAYIRPEYALNKTKRELKNVFLGVIDSRDTSSYLVESIGPKINWNGPTRVYFGVARYLNGVRSAELISNPIYISANVNESTSTEEYNPDVVDGTVENLSQNDLAHWLSVQMSIDFVSIDGIIIDAFKRIKDVVAKGGSVTIDDFGKFEAYWSKPLVRVDRVTGTSTTTTAQRNARFVPSKALILGTQRGMLLSNVTNT